MTTLISELASQKYNALDNNSILFNICSVYMVFRAIASWTNGRNRRVPSRICFFRHSRRVFISP